MKSTAKGAGFHLLQTSAFILGCALAAVAHGQPAEIVKIGFASPLTGPQAHYGQDNLNGARMAIEELNARNPRIGGRPARFELVAEDDHADPRTGTIVAQRLVDAGIRGMAGHFKSSEVQGSRFCNAWPFCLVPCTL